MSIQIGVIMDPIESISVHKDSTLAIMLAAQARNWKLHYMELKDLFLENTNAKATMQSLSVKNDPTHWFIRGESRVSELAELDVILMRKDPPFNTEYVYATYILEQAEQQGCLVVNKPQSLRDANEKLFTSWFPECCPPTLVSRNSNQFRAFLEQHQDIILKPLDSMGGHSIFHLNIQDLNIQVIIETLTDAGQKFAMAQKFIPEISKGDKRILMINGEAIPYALARVPKSGDFRGNLTAGAKGIGIELSERDRWICDRVAQTLRQKGLYFVGLDVIGDYLTEINVTSPMCIRELDKIYDLDIGAQLIDCIEHLLAA